MRILLRYLTVVLVAVLSVRCENSHAVLVLEEQADVYARAHPRPEEDTRHENAVISTVRRGESVELLGTEYKKDYAAYRVRLKDGRVGYLMSGVQFRKQGDP